MSRACASLRSRHSVVIKLKAKGECNCSAVRVKSFVSEKLD